ncbi:MAG: mannose-1-phosphate guanylyltransferase/mannose-6-phosphate isomerase, partial [Gammaproteobacteria bacterium]
MSSLSHLLPVILAGGGGTRLWPLSREHYPKQFLALTGEQSLLQQTVARLEGSTERPPLVICNEEHRFLVAEQLRRLGIERPRIVLEPVGRNTAPALTVAALEALRDGVDPILAMMPADHAIGDPAAFREALARGAALAGEGAMVTFGIVPDRPETGYGYLETGEPAGEGSYLLSRFVEKP